MLLVVSNLLKICPGIDIHYLHVKPKKVPEGTSAVPLIMVHGWPGSFYEFYGLIPLLTDLSNPHDLVFEVVCPSIPGYGFSEAPHKKGEPGISLLWPHYPIITVVTVSLDSFIMVKDFKITIFVEGEIKKLPCTQLVNTSWVQGSFFVNW